MISDAVQTNVIRSIKFNGKTSYRIVKPDPVCDDTVLVSDTQVETEEGVIAGNTIVLNETTDSFSTKKVAANTKKIDDVSTIIESKLNDLNVTIEKRLHHLEDQITGLQNLNQSGNVVSNKPVASSGFYVDLLKSSISELEKQLLEKNAVINFLTLQLISKPQDKTTCKCSHNKNYQNGINNDKENDTALEKEVNHDQSSKVVIIGDSMLNNINGRGLSKTNKVDVLKFPDATSADIVTKIDDVLDEKPESIIIHAGTNDLTNDINLLSNVKKIVNKTNKISPNTILKFSNIIVRKDKRYIEKTRADTNSRLKNFCMQKNIDFLSNENIKEEHLGIKKLHLNRKGNSIFAKNLLNCINGN